LKNLKALLFNFFAQFLFYFSAYYIIPSFPYICHSTLRITHQVRDLLRGDPDTDVQIVFDREESTFFIKKQLAGGVKGTQNFPR
jgi:hypothetical protein